MTEAPPCRHCGPFWPAVAEELCLLCLQRMVAATRTLLDLIDTRADLTDLATRRDWVAATRFAATDVAYRLGDLDKREVAA